MTPERRALRKVAVSDWARRALALAATLSASACDLASIGPEAQGVAGIWREERIVESVPEIAFLRVASYTLHLAETDGFIHGRWVIVGDTLLPLDPWEAVVVGEHVTAESRLLLEYHDPSLGRCSLAGPVNQADGHLRDFVAERRCAANGWGVSDVFHFYETPAGDAAIIGWVTTDNKDWPGVKMAIAAVGHSFADTASTNSHGNVHFRLLRAGSYYMDISVDTTKYSFPYTDTTFTIGSGELHIASFHGVTK
ncbi:MAG: hypothetical protein F4Z31_02750 [Gemmatimonadetes bacterium]|nr:hypothetical protein [Gemmatimonadota bacterium]MYE92482.1 hypothetical protein [Gemmatimonadota bacterium]MYJ10917.1 hypothetical protein [Gemmatimonadota bacterium]